MPQATDSLRAICSTRPLYPGSFRKLHDFQPVVIQRSDPIQQIHLGHTVVHVATPCIRLKVAIAHRCSYAVFPELALLRRWSLFRLQRQRSSRSSDRSLQALIRISRTGFPDSVSPVSIAATLQHLSSRCQFTAPDK